MSDPAGGGTSPPEWAGIVGGIVTMLGVLGGGIAWLAAWLERRASGRAAKLQIWHEELREREAALDAEHAEKVADWEARLERRVANLEEGNRALRGENRTLRLAFELVSAPLRTLEPAHPNLAKAEKLLEAAFPLDPSIPPAMGKALGAID